jgi:hypothetical protein
VRLNRQIRQMVNWCCSWGWGREEGEVSVSFEREERR